MKSGYKIQWTENALDELTETFEYLELNWTERESRKLSEKIEQIIKLISENPSLFPKSENAKVRKAVVHKLNTIYYKENITNESIEILSFFNNRKKPKTVTENTV